MTLQELASFVCSKVGKKDTNTLSVTKDFIKNRYKMVWESFTWNDSKIMVTQSVASDTLDLTVNAQIELVIAVAWNGLKLSNIQPETVMAYNPALLNEAGGPVAYITMPKDSSGNCVIRFITRPQEAKDVLILGKKVFSQLDDDTDEPLLRGIQNALLALGEADLLEREKQRGSAQLKFQEAQAMIQKMIDIEVNQQTKKQKLVPKIYDAPRRYRFTPIRIANPS